MTATMTPVAPLVLESRHTGERLALLRVEREGETWLEIKGSLPAHSEGPPLHVHAHEDEEGYVVAGTLSAIVGGIAERATGATKDWADEQATQLGRLVDDSLNAASDVAPAYPVWHQRGTPVLNERFSDRGTHWR
jgi:photosystem II stability/assembly factor-like uncharacterized protein